MLNGGQSSKGPERPLPDMMCTLMDAAHYAHEQRKVLHPQTYAYSMFQWRSKESVEGAAAPSSSGTPAAQQPPRHSYSSALPSPRPARVSGSGNMGSPTSRPGRDNSLTGDGDDVRRMSDLGESNALCSSPAPGDLEVQCLYDATFQAANAAGQHGAEVRGIAPPTIGPIAYLYRWYCKRSTTFAGGNPRPEDVPDAPAMPAKDEAGGPARARKSSAGATAGRTLNRMFDPVINLNELTEMLEDLGVVPHLASRADIATLFAAVAGPKRPSRQAAASSSSSVSISRALSGSTAGFGGGSGGFMPPAVARARSGPQLGSAPPAPVVLASAQVRPEEIRYPQFLDLLARLGVAIACLQQQQEGPPPQQQQQGPPQPHLGPKRMPPDAARAALRALLRRMGLDRADMAGLKQQLDALARMAGEKGCRAKELKLAYVTGRSCCAAAQGTVVEHPLPRGLVRVAVPGGMPVAAGAVAGTSYGTSPPWSPLAPGKPPPPYLLELLQEEDRATFGEYRPRWHEFGTPSLDLGVLQPGELRVCRLVLHNRGVYALAVRLESAGAPFCRCSYGGLASLLPGVPRTVDVLVRCSEVGEVVGELRLYFCSRWQPAERAVSVPVYAMVGLGQAGKPVATARSVRSSVASKTGGEVLPRAVAASATLMGPLSHYVPPTGAAAHSTPSSAASTRAAQQQQQQQPEGCRAAAGSAGRPPSAALAHTAAAKQQHAAMRTASGRQYYSAGGAGCSGTLAVPSWATANGRRSSTQGSMVCEQPAAAACAYDEHFGAGWHGAASPSFLGGTASSGGFESLMPSDGSRSLAQSPGSMTAGSRPVSARPGRPDSARSAVLAPGGIPLPAGIVGGGGHPYPLHTTGTYAIVPLPEEAEGDAAEQQQQQPSGSTAAAVGQEEELAAAAAAGAPPLLLQPDEPQQQQQQHVLGEELAAAMAMMPASGSGELHLGDHLCHDTDAAAQSGDGQAGDKAMRRRVSFHDGYDLPGPLASPGS